jgi:CDP-glycerol glycerophosphotransferase
METPANRTPDPDSARPPAAAARPAGSRNALRSAIVSGAKRLPALAALVRARRDSKRESEYRSLWGSNPMDSAVAVFESYDARGYSCSPRALYQTMLRDRRFEGVEKVWVLRAETIRALAGRGGYDIRGLEGSAPGPSPEIDLDRTLGAGALAELRQAVIVPWRSPEHRRSYARAGLWISNTMAPAHFALRPGQSYLQTWHGTPLKRLGCDIAPGTSGSAVLSVSDIHARYRREGKRFTWLLSQCRYATDRLASAFDLAAAGRMDAVVEEGYPRNDFLHTFGEADIADVKSRLGIPQGKRVVLYAPTWREDQHSSGVGYTFDSGVDFQALREALGDEYVVLFRTHCLVSAALDLSAHEGFVLDVSAIDDVNDLYVVSDLLVTDYSSVFFDFANLRRPIVFFLPDLDTYSGHGRGLYLGTDDLPGRIVMDTPQLIDAIRAGENPSGRDRERLARFGQRFTYLDDGRAGERVIERMLAGGALRTGSANQDAGGAVDR